MSRFEKWKKQAPVETDIRLARVTNTEIGYLNSIVESYEGLGILRTRDADMGLVEFWMVPDFRDEMLNLIEEMRKEFKIVWVPRSQNDDELFGVVGGVGYNPKKPETNVD